MLAAPREKTRYIVQPRGKPLYDDQNSFGLKMLQKMGWSKDKGLGVKEDGQKEFITLRYKNDQGGMGFQEKDDQWTENENQFDSLLKSLNQGEEEAQRQSESLEEKSKVSRARVHYKKFTRGKDTSRYSAKDLANIFGKKTLDESESLVQSEVDEERKKSGESGEEAGALKHGVETYQSNVSSYDYFKKKLGKFFGKKDEDQEDKLMEEVSTPIEEEQEIQPEEKKKKKKKRKASEDDIVEEAVPAILEEEPVKKKAKKKKDPEQEEEVPPFVDLATNTEGDGESLEKASKKSKKSKKQKQQVETIEILDNSIKADDDEQVIINLNESEEAVPVKKSKKEKRKQKEEQEVETPVDEEPEKKVKKSKKKEKQPETISLLEDSEDQPQEVTEKRSKKKKSKNEE